MTNYSVTSYSTRGDYAAVLTALETRIETIDATKAIYLYSIVKSGNEFVGLLVYAT